MELTEAFRFASEHHSSQVKPGTEAPFLYHPLAVAALALKYGGNEDQVRAALLHDTIGGGKITESDLAAKFGAETARLVFAFSDPPLPPNADWQMSRQAYLEKLKTLDEAALFVVACEELHEISETMSDLRYQGKKAWDRYPMHPMVVFWYFRELLHLFYRRLSAERYRQLVGEMGAWVKQMSDIVFEGGPSGAA